MSRTIQFTLPLIELASQLDHQVVMPLGFSDTCQLDVSLDNVADHFRRALQSQLLQKGRYLEFLRLLQPHSYKIDSFQIDIIADPKGDQFPKQSVEFDFVHWQTEETYLGLVPVLAVGGSGASVEILVEQLKGAVSLYLFKQGLTRSIRDLIALQWYERTVIKPVDIETVFYTPNELEAFRRDEGEPLLPKTARRMSTPALPAFGLARQVESLKHNLEGEFRQSVLIVGPPGSGKSALIGEYIRAGGLPFHARPWQTSAARMLQMLTECGGWQYQLGLWCKEVSESGAVVNIGPLYELFEVGQYSGNSISIAEALRDPLQRGEITLICEGTEEQLERLNRRSPGYSDLFMKIDLGDSKPAEQDAIMLQAVGHLAKQSKITLAPGVVQEVITLQRRYSPYSGFPGKTIRFMESLMLAESGQSQAERRLEKQNIIAAYCQESGLPRFLVDEMAELNTVELKNYFDNAIVGQSLAKQAIQESLLAVKAGLHQSGRPIASFLFIGPTGTGKTQITKTLARYLFGSSDRMLRFDMSEYSDPWSVSRLIQTGEASLVTKVRQTPFSVLLFDEIEKADPSFNDLLLQILGEGRLSDDRGEVANFCSAIIIMTSNIGAADFSRSSMTFSNRVDTKSDVINHFENSVKRHFRPELYNRIDQVVPFLILGVEERQAIIRLELDALVNNMQSLGQTHTLRYDHAVCVYLAQQPLESRYGARAIQRLLDQQIINPLSAELARVRRVLPHEINISVNSSVIAFEIKPKEDGGRAGESIQQIADTIARLRKSLYLLQERSHWLGLLSRLDRLEGKRRKNEKKFWSNPDLVAPHKTINTFQRQHAALLEQALGYEKQTIDSLLFGMDAGQETVLQQAMTTLITNRQQLFTEVLAYIKPEMNQALLVIHGTEPYLSSWADQYRQLLKVLAADAQSIYLYRRKGEEKPPLSELICTIRHEDPDEHYQIYTKLHQKLAAPAALGFLVKSPCIGYFLKQEEGIVSSVTEAGKDAKLSIEVFTGDLQNYHPPEAVYRKKFYDKKKSSRRMRGKQLELLERSGAVAEQLSWQFYQQWRHGQGRTSIIAELVQEDEQ